MQHWDYCVLTVATYREGGGGPTRELFSVARPGSSPAAIASPLGLPGVLNALGSEGWQLVDVESGAFYFTRPRTGAS